MKPDSFKLRFRDALFSPWLRECGISAKHIEQHPSATNIQGRIGIFSNREGPFMTRYVEVLRSEKNANVSERACAEKDVTPSALQDRKTLGIRFV